MTTTLHRPWEELLILMDHRSMSQVHLARATGMSPQYINDLVRGRRRPGRRSRVKIAEVLGVPDGMLIPSSQEGCR